ncbi:uncharacterized protein B0H18DRAFT_1112778 [Fomitopsis serialis]|uniref:uncharacterized protein n=1 Tax=Fomitopsis serialis TaxID=139415 RepID=UPI002007CA23|nr:uncharacterized protein B0H18DRAFT_1112778 [Neoantrodia serialis]KAH9938647.1 hypothetical protein B0H18DRAFT_1112778 [Neoantrodia serialis]
MSVLLHIGLPELLGHGYLDFLGLLTAGAPLPVLYLAYGCSLYLSVFLGCRVVLGRLELLGYRTSRRNARKHPATEGRHSAKEGRRPATQPVITVPWNKPGLRLFKTGPSKGEQARRLRAAREASLKPLHDYFQSLKPTVPISYGVLTDKRNGSQSATVPVTPAVDGVSVKPTLDDSDAPKPRTAPRPPHKYRIASTPGYRPFNLHLPTYAPDPYYTKGDRLWDAQKKLYAERLAKNASAVAQRPVKEVQVVEAAPKPEEDNKRPTTVTSVVPVASVPVAPVVPEPAKQPSRAPKVKVRVEKVKLLKKRTHAVLERQAKTMSLLDATPSPHSGFANKAVKRVYEPMDVDMYDAEDLMDVDLPDPVDELCDRFATIL